MFREWALNMRYCNREIETLPWKGRACMELLHGCERCLTTLGPPQPVSWEGYQKYFRKELACVFEWVSNSIFWEGLFVRPFYKCTPSVTSVRWHCELVSYCRKENRLPQKPTNTWLVKVGVTLVDGSTVSPAFQGPTQAVIHSYTWCRQVNSQRAKVIPSAGCSMDTVSPWDTFVSSITLLSHNVFTFCIRCSNRMLLRATCCVQQDTTAQRPFMFSRWVIHLRWNVWLIPLEKREIYCILPCSHFSDRWRTPFRSSWWYVSPECQWWFLVTHNIVQWPRHWKTADIVPIFCPFTRQTFNKNQNVAYSTCSGQT